MIDKEYIDHEFQIIEAMNTCQKCKSKIIKHGKVEEARKTGQRYQVIDEEDTEIILNNLKLLYKYYGEISNAALSLQAEVVMMENKFKKSIRKVE